VERDLARLNCNLSSFYSQFLGRRLQFDDKAVKKNVRHFFKFTGPTHEYLLPSAVDAKGVVVKKAITSLLAVVLLKRYNGELFPSGRDEGKKVPSDDMELPEFGGGSGSESDNDMDDEEWNEKNKARLQEHEALRLKKQKEKLAKVVERLQNNTMTLIDRAVLFSYDNPQGSNKMEVTRAMERKKDPTTGLTAEEDKRRCLLNHVDRDMQQHPLWVGFEESSEGVKEDVESFKNQVAGLRARNAAKRDELKALRAKVKELRVLEKEVKLNSELWKVNRPNEVVVVNANANPNAKANEEKTNLQEEGKSEGDGIGLSFVSPGAV